MEIYVGVIGAVLLLLAFVLLEFKKISRTTLGFHVLNFIGAILLLIYAYVIKSYIFLFLNLVWSAVAIYEVIKLKK